MKAREKQEGTKKIRNLIRLKGKKEENIAEKSEDRIKVEAKIGEL